MIAINDQIFSFHFFKHSKASPKMECQENENQRATYPIYLRRIEEDIFNLSIRKQLQSTDRKRIRKKEALDSRIGITTTLQQ